MQIVFWDNLLEMLKPICQAIWFRYSYRNMVELVANSGDPDQMPHSAAFDLGLHGLPVTCLGIQSSMG